MPSTPSTHHGTGDDSSNHQRHYAKNETQMSLQPSRQPSLAGVIVIVTVAAEADLW